MDVDEKQFQGFHTICELNVIIYGLSLLLKTMGFYKVHIMNRKKIKIIILVLCIHVQNIDIKVNLNIGWRTFLETNELLMPNYLVIAWKEKITMEMFCKRIYENFLVVFHSIQPCTHH